MVVDCRDSRCGHGRKEICRNIFPTSGFVVDNVCDPGVGIVYRRIYFKQHARSYHRGSMLMRD